MNILYPLKFEPIYKERIWGGNNLHTKLNKELSPENNYGESWEISAVEDSVSVVANGFLAGNNLQEIIEIYMGEIVGDSVYDKFGIEFPLLFKYIDANDVLSVQVHPDNEIAMKRHHAYGKTELWYIIEAKPEAELILGFNSEITKEQYLQHIENKTLTDILNKVKIEKNQAYFIPSGRVHAIGSGILLAEIQQTSDITYRIFDWNRKDKKGNYRELHTDLALDCINFETNLQYRTDFVCRKNFSSPIERCKYFTTNILEFNSEIHKDIAVLDSFVVYMCLEGSYSIVYDEVKTVKVSKGETILIPAIIDNYKLVPESEAKLLEIYIESDMKFAASLN